MQGADVNADCGAGMCALHISALRGGGKGSREVKQSLRFRLFVEPGCRGMSWDVVGCRGMSWDVVDVWF